MLGNFAHWCLTGMLFFIPFQQTIVMAASLRSKELSIFFNRLDKFAISLLLPLAVIEFYKKRETFDRLYLVLIFSIFSIVIIGVISGMARGNSMLITSQGIFDYIKYFIVIFIYAAFFRDFDRFRKIFRSLLIMTMFIVLMAVLQEIFATYSRYIVGKDIADEGIYLFRNITDSEIANAYWRFGLYKTPSLMHHPSLLGLYCLLILTIYLFLEKKINLSMISALIVGIFLSISRIVYTGFVVMAGVQIFRNRRWLIAAVIPLFILLLKMSSIDDSNIFETSTQLTKHESVELLEPLKNQSNTEDGGGANYRAYARGMAMKVWKDHLFLGVGPGMFGGPISITYKSPIYKEYNFSNRWALYYIKSLDQFWPQVLAETGILGAVAFAGLFISLFVTLFILRKWETSDLRGLFTGLIVFTIVIIIFSLGLPLNQIPVLFTYSALVGIGFGCSNKQRSG